ncbi:uncharacterized protein CBL_10888 [Carabus blaptoides fortunei]
MSTPNRNQKKMCQHVGVNTGSTNLPHTPTPILTSVMLKERDIPHINIKNVTELAEIYDFKEMLGKGHFGTVIEISAKTSKTIWALKIVDKPETIPIRGTRINTIDNEVRILKMVNHPHIIYLEKIYESAQRMYLVMERCITELATIARQKKHFTESEVRKVLKHLASAVAYLHKYEIVHRDLKLENILTAPNPDDPFDELYIKVSDFGLGIIKAGNRPDQMLNDRCGTLAYMAPEVISLGSYSQQCDVWAMGVVCFILLVGSYPYFSVDESELSEMITNTEPKYNEFRVSPAAVNLLTKMLCKNPALRISAAEVGRHAWLRGASHEHDSPENVLDMMQLWSSEMMMQTSDRVSDWATAFSIVEKSLQSDQTEISIDDEQGHVSRERPISSKGQRSGNTVTSKNSDKPKYVTITDDGKSVTKHLSPPSRPLTTLRKRGPVRASTNNMAATVPVVRHSQRALNISGKSTKLMQIGKPKSDVIKGQGRPKSVLKIEAKNTDQQQ